MLDKLSQGRAKARMPRSLILEPTRELAAQVAGDFDNYGRHHRLTQALLIGGESMDAQIRRMETGVDVLIATLPPDGLVRSRTHLDDGYSHVRH